MKAVLKTPLPGLANELCDVLKLFWTVEAFAVEPTVKLTPRETAKAQYTASPVTGDMEPLLHEFQETGGLWRCAFTLRGYTAERTMQPPLAWVATDGAHGPDLSGGISSEADTDEAEGANSHNAYGADAREAGGADAAQDVSDVNGEVSREAGGAEAGNDANGANPRNVRGTASGKASCANSREANGADTGEPEAWPAGDPDALLRRRLQKRLCKLTLYGLCKDIAGTRPPWGSLTGIRPTRLFYEKLAQGLTPPEAANELVSQFDVTPDKADLLRRIVAVQQTLPPPSPNEADVYVSIPFCRTRCAYCSFPGEALGKGAMVKPYLQALFHEMRATAALMQAQNLRLRALYIGGGTPTALDEAAFAALLDTVAECFPTPYEFTVEAGRPDTITQGKLNAMLSHRVTRISVNPQTMNDATLRAIGRDHTAAQTEEAFRLARSLGFTDINMDVIAGLPTETPADFARTMARIGALAPDSLTVHTLAIKRSSRLHLEGAALPNADAVAEMIGLGEQTAAALGMEPYYLYRQKYMAGQQQNVGYARAGAACLYNVDIMEETNSILACGAGSISKRVFADRELRIERAPNVSNVAEYIARVAEMERRKQALFD
ncbi:MAG TPA: coproporphyrinogen dehydrogenase HemZ [Candidatus Limiplasma sp.]|nr:coproporphyrinogen dehydrogenase HemZ [Candidatus Limiplasma sp.]HPS81233.1 coproporphyrinogen dehydrogenase HemZ [Candidatus Limiplasma sp.]